MHLRRFNSAMESNVLQQIYSQEISKGEEVKALFDKITIEPKKTQEELILKILDDNKETEYGRKYDFASIKSIEEYRTRVPLTTFQDYTTYVEKMMDGERDILTAYNTTHFISSSGTSGKPKRIPFSEKYGECISRYTMPIIINMLNSEGILGSTRMQNITQSFISTLPSGCTFGSIASISMKKMESLLDFISVPSYEILAPTTNFYSWYLHSFFALSDREIAGTMCSFYSFYLTFICYVETNWARLADDIENGVLDPDEKIPTDLRERLQAKIRPMPERAEQIRAVFREEEYQPLVPKLWPNHQFLIGIGSAVFQVYSEKLKLYFGNRVQQLKLGLNSSEAIISIPVKMNDSRSVIIPDSAFYEFLPEGETDFSKLLNIDELEEGKNYELIITNLSGFYRYKIRDVVKVVGMYQNTPMIEFLYRADQTINLVGEKTTEEMFRDAVKMATDEIGIDVVDYSIYPNSEITPVRYEFLIEPMNGLPEGFDKEVLRAKIDEKLAITNPLLAYEQRKGSLAPSKLLIIQEETNLLYRELVLYKGGNAVQTKPPRILNQSWIKEFFYALQDDRY